MSLEIDLEAKGRLTEFEAAFQKLHGKAWSAEKGMLAFALGQASATLHLMMPEVFPQKDSWARGRPKLDITPGRLADRIVELMKRRKPGNSLMFVVDEVGQFVARDVQKMLDLQAIVQQLGVKGRGKHWIVVTSQEKLNELVGGLDDKRIELARLMDRFPQELQVHLEPSDISEVTSQRVLRKNAAAEAELGSLFDEHRARLALHSRLTADITLPDLGRQAFVDLYPLLPYQIVLIIDIVSGLRTQGGASKHVGGANRTIIKLAQQLLINPLTKLAEKPTGTLVRLDHVYDLIDGNIASDIRAKIASIPQRVSHPDAQAVAKVVCLLQFVKTVHRTPENIAAALLDKVDGESRLTAVKEALAELEKALMVRLGEGGYRIPTPAEDDWDQTRTGIDLRGADRKRILTEILSGFWTPQPVFSLGDTKQFRAGLMVNGTEAVAGDITFNLQLADDAAEAAKLADEVRRRSQLEQKSVFWVATLDEDIEREAREAYRSSQMIERKSRGAVTANETTLIAEEKVRQKRHQDELRRRLRTACLSGQVFFRGNDRSPEPTVTDVGRAASAVLGQALPTVYDRFQEASAKAPEIRKGLDALLTAANLSGLPPVFAQLNLLRDEKGKPVFRTDFAPLSEIMGQIEAKANYGEQATGKFLEDEFAKAPFGWDLEAVRLFAICLLRAGRVEAVSKGQTIESATTVQAKECFTNNNLFRSANFRPKKGIDFAVLAEAATHFSDTFGNEIRELSASTLAAQLRTEVERHEEPLGRVLGILREARLPGTEMLDNALSQMRAIRKAGDESSISTFLAGHRSIKDAIHRGGELDKVLTEPALRDIERARAALARMPALCGEADLDPMIATRGTDLADLIQRETFFRDLATIDQSAAVIDAEFQRRLGEALDARVGAHLTALEVLHATPGWERLDVAQQEEVSRSLRQGAERAGAPENLAHLRSETEACAGRLSAAISRVHELLEGERLASVSVAPFFAGGIETEEQLDQAIAGLRDAFSRLIGEGKRIIVR
ncbi:BREX system P-loop protein BrxC [Falsiroseomonas ponticola]|uniref:BREX system P-loop protein BrxC n=1 Tax=Falsiroseomonas ponticola TaxID=2786951 RepID=UPI0019341D5E|nr:BREX system P-loop protein BrxC [Roseomonas ponticola]